MSWNIFIISLCLLLLAFTLWKEITRKNKDSLYPRIVATVLAIVSLSLIELPVTVRRLQKSVDSSTAIFLTDGFKKDSIQNFVKGNPGVKIFTTDKNIRFANADFIADPGHLAESPYDISTLHLFGYGLLEHDLRRLNKMNVVFHGTPVANRITKIDWQHNITSGDKLLVQGKFKNTTKGAVKIVLSGFDTHLDSALLSSGQTSNFELSTIPKHVDKAVYAVTVLSDGDTVEVNPIPVSVRIPGSINVLVLASSPDFDNKFLKNWLAENEYGFAARTYISKNKYERQYVNVPSAALGRLSPSLLDKFDVVIADLAELSAMPSSDISTLRTYIESRGLGLIVKVTSVTRSGSFYLSSFPLIAAKDSIQHTLRLHARNLIFPSAIKIQQPVYILNRPTTDPILTDQHTRTLASSTQLGLGKVVVTTIPNSYAWWLGGNKDDYAAYWTTLLSTAAKKTVTDFSWERSPMFPRKDYEMNVRLQSVNDSLPRLQVSGEEIYPSQNPYLPYDWSGRYWPERAGWHALKNDDENAAWIYVYGDSDWQGIAATEKIRVTKNYAGANGGNSASKTTNIVPVEIPKFYFLILFIISAAFLWFEKKYRNG